MKWRTSNIPLFAYFLAKFLFFQFLTRVLYQRKSLTLYIHALSVVHCRLWHRHWCLLCTPLLASGLDIELRIWYEYVLMSLVYTRQIFSHSDQIVFKWLPFWYFSLICYPLHMDTQRLHVAHTHVSLL